MPMPTPDAACAEFVHNDMEKGLERAVDEIFSTMFGESACFISPNEIPDTPRVSSIIGFAGRISGFLALHFSKEMACKVAEGFLGMPVTEIDDTVQDAVAELVNMTAGGFKKQLSGTQDSFKVSIPSVVQGM